MISTFSQRSDVGTGFQFKGKNWTSMSAIILSTSIRRPTLPGLEPSQRSEKIARPFRDVHREIRRRLFLVLLLKKYLEDHLKKYLQ